MRETAKHKNLQSCLGEGFVSFAYINLKFCCPNPATVQQKITLMAAP
jgi:hypothetical protein